MRPFVRIAGNLSLATSDFSASIPAFNPQRMLTEGGSDEDNAAAAAAAAEPEASVAFVMRDLPPMLGKVKIASTTPTDEVLVRVREAADWMEKTARHLPVAANIGGIKLAYATEGNTNDPYAGFEARIVPENITLLPKTTNETKGGNAWNERTVAAKKGDTVTSILTELGATAEDIKDRRRARCTHRREAPEGRPEAARPAGADRKRQPPAADPRDRRQRKRGRCRGRAVRHRQIRVGRRQERRHRSRRQQQG